MDYGQAINRLHMKDGGGGERLYITSPQTGPLQMARVSQLRQMRVLIYAVCLQVNIRQKMLSAMLYV